MDSADKKSGLFQDTREQFNERRAKNAERKSKGLSSDDFADNNKKDSKQPTDKLAQRGARANSAASGLTNLEKAATGNLPLKGADNLAGVKKNEENAGGLYSGDGKKKTAKGKGSFFKKGPAIGVILTLALCGGIFSFGGLSMQLISWKENIVSQFGENSAVLNKRSNFVLKRILSTNSNVTSDSIFGGTKFKISSNLQEKLKAQGIDYVETDGGTRMLVYADADGNYVPIVASDADVGKVPSSVDIDGETINLDTGKIKTLDIAKTDLDGFKTSLDTATITFTGKVAGWFDSVTDNVLKRIGGDSPRNKTADLTNDSTEEDVNKVLYDNVSDGANDSTHKVIDTDEDGNETGTEIETGDDSLKVGDVDADSVDQKLTARAEAAAKIADAANIGCSFLRAIGAISVTVGAIQTANVINFALTYLELADKTKAGDANNSYNIAENNLNKVTTTTAYNKDGHGEELIGSTTSSTGWNSTFSDTNLVDEDSAEANMVNRESAIKTAILSSTNGSGKITSTVASAVMSFGAGITAFHTCNTIQAASSAMNLVLFFFSGGLSEAGETFAQIFKSLVVNAVVGAAISAVVMMVVPLTASWLGGNLQSVFQGKVGGTALLSGGHAVQDSNLQASTGVYASKEGAIELYAMTRDVETEWAEYERDTKSPFDTSSQYTFLGSLINKITPAINQSSDSAVSSATSIAGLASDSLVSLVSDTASAANDVNNYAVSLASDENCPSLSSVGVAGDFACNKYSGAYVDELTTVDSTTIYDWMANNTDTKGRPFFEMDGGEVKLNSEGNPVINAKSDYGYYLVACVSNDVQPGAMSSAVEGFIEKTTDTGSIAGNTAINFGLNFVPVVGDFLDGISALEALDREKWNSGQACTGNSGDAAVDEEVRYFSMYNLDQRVFEEMGIINKSSTTAFLEDYYEENPIDNNSLEGILAHYGGMNDAEIDYVLGLIEYADFIANYDPSTRYAFGAPVVEEDHTIKYDNENILGGEYIILNQIAYADVRNRTMVV